MTRHHYPIRESDWTVKDIGTKARPVGDIHIIKDVLVTGDDRKWMMENSYYLHSIYKKVFPGKEARRAALINKRIKVLKIEIKPKVIGYADRDIYKKSEYGNVEN